MTTLPPPTPSTNRPGTGRPGFILALATAGFAINAAAWVLIAVFGPQTRQWSGLTTVGQLVLVTLPLVIGAAARIPVGALTDRYGARRIFPAVSLASAGSLVLFAMDSSVALVAAACSVGIAGTSFAVGAALVIRRSRPNRRGFDLSVFGVGIGGAAVAAASMPAIPDGVGVRAATLTLAGLLVAHAVVAIATTPPGPARHGKVLRPREAFELLRLPATRRLSLLYAVAFAPKAATVLFLPAYLQTAYRTSWREAVLVAAGFVGVSAAARPAGGWLAERRSPTRILATCLVSAGVLGVVTAFQPPLLPAGAIVLASAAICLGMASGTVLSMAGNTVPVERAGTIVGTVGAIGGLTGLLPPVVLGAVFRLEHSYAIGIVLLSCALVITAGYLHLRLEAIRGGLTFPATGPAAADLDSIATTVVALSAAETAGGGSAALASLAELAARHELAIVYADGHRPAGCLESHALVTALRALLARRAVVAVVVDVRQRAAQVDFAVLTDLLEDGTIGVAVVNAVDPMPTAALLGVHLDADQVLRLDRHPTEGVRLHPVTRAFAGRKVSACKNPAVPPVGGASRPSSQSHSG